MGHERVELGVDRAEAGARESLWVEIDLEVVGADFGGEMGIIDGLEQFDRDRGRLPRLVDDEHFLLGADMGLRRIEHSGFEHVFKRMNVPQHPVHCYLPLLDGPGCLYSHN